MKIGAYQFAVTGDIHKNYECIEKAISTAAQQDVRLLVFSECALTGYPPVKVPSPEAIDYSVVSDCLNRLKSLSKELNLYLLIGSVLREIDGFYNALVFIAPDNNSCTPYYKRALWGWDRDNFTPGKNVGIYLVDNVRIGVCICFDADFPEYFRDLFRAETVLNIVSFCDVANQDDSERYEIHKSLLRTRALENVCPILSVNDISPFQTAPTAYFEQNGKVAAELPKNKENLLVYDFEISDLSYGLKGRKLLSKQLNS